MNVKIAHAPHLQTDFEVIEIGKTIKLIHKDERVLTGKLSCIKEDMIYLENEDGEEVIKVDDITCCYMCE